ncbi:carbohydrate ABC transporter permease [Gorillibacterium sp. sgz5001074]|uniref:carbohydrate ABC transporter permease n=1 Tax=Gorillibacterium sp. sgz5001074 TaxID=3446695 RepID=UPI003F666FD3
MPRITKEEKVAFWFVAPFLVGFSLFYLLPTLYAFVISSLDYNSFKEFTDVKFAGLANYIRVFKDPIAISSFGRSLLFTSCYVPGIIVTALMLSMMFNAKFHFRTFTRTLIMLPYVTNVVAIAIVFSILLNPYDGVVNKLLVSWGIAHPPQWLAGIRTSLVTVAGIEVWHSIAFPTIVYLAALQGVPRDLYESAEIDGAGRIRKFLSVTMPLISPTTFFLVITNIIGSFQNYAIFRVLTNGGPGTSSRVISLNIYEEAFSYNKYSYASAQAILLFLVILFITIIQWRGQKKWVHY